MSGGEDELNGESRKENQYEWSSDRRTCPLPHYIILECILSFFPLVTFLRLPVILKAVLILPMAGMFILVIQYTHFTLFTCFDARIG